MVTLGGKGTDESQVESDIESPKDDSSSSSDSSSSNSDNSSSSESEAPAVTQKPLKNKNQAANLASDQPKKKKQKLTDKMEKQDLEALALQLLQAQ